MKTVAVMFGGRSDESEISVLTGLFVLRLLEGRYRVLPVFLAEEGMVLFTGRLRVEAFAEGLPPHRPAALVRGGLRVGRRTIPLDCALNCCHGGMGEDGTLAALLRWYAIPSASPSHTLCAAAMSKSLSLCLARGAGVPVAEFVTLRSPELSAPEREAIAALGFPLIVKPDSLGSSIGVCFAADEAQLAQALQTAFALDHTVLAQRCLPACSDLNCAAYVQGGALQLSPVEEVRSRGPLLTFDEKYVPTAPRAMRSRAALPAETEKQVHAHMRTLAAVLPVRGIVRADFLLSEGQVYFNELNAVPGSLALYLFGERLTQCKTLLCSLIEEAHPEEERTPLHTGILRLCRTAGAKGGKLRRGGEE